MRNLTPFAFRCSLAACPAVHIEDDGKHLRIIGKKTDVDELEKALGDDESAIRISRDLVRGAIGGPISRLLMRVGL